MHTVTVYKICYHLHNKIILIFKIDIFCHENECCNRFECQDWIILQKSDMLRGVQVKVSGPFLKEETAEHQLLEVERMKLQAVKREKTGSSAARAARAEDKITGVIYKSGQESIPVLIDHKEMQDIVRKQGRNAVFEIAIEGGETAQVIIKHVSRAALKPEIYNIELQAIEKGQTVVVTVPINIIGANDVVDGIVSQTLNELEIETTPDKIPAEITVHLDRELPIGSNVSVAELQIPEGVSVVTEAETPVAVVSAKVTEELPEDGTEVPAESEEPEVG